MLLNKNKYWDEILEFNYDGIWLSKSISTHMSQLIILCFFIMHEEV